MVGVVLGVQIPDDRAARNGLAVAILKRNGAALRRLAGRYSLCADDADDALQRAIEILLTKSPPLEPGRLIAWLSVVTKHEALAVRRSRERLLGGSAAVDPEAHLGALAHHAPGPLERVERRERVAERRRELAALKANERLAIVLQAQGYSYEEICALCGWTYTKVNRCLAEGRAALRAPRSGRAAAGRRAA